jgi:ankyrin repeat protein
MENTSYKDRNSYDARSPSMSFNRSSLRPRSFCCFSSTRQVNEPNNLCLQILSNNHLAPRKEMANLASRTVKQHIDLPKDLEEQKKLLHRAIRLGDIQTIKSLKDQGVYFHSKDKYDNKPLHIAIMMMGNDDTTFRYLLSNFTVMDLLFDLNKDGFSPLELAIVQNNKTAVEICFDNYNNLDINRIYCAEQSLIQLAYNHNSMDVIEILEKASDSKTTPSI